MTQKRNVALREDELTDEAFKAFAKSPLSQRQLARLLNVTESAISKALRKRDEQLTQLRLKIIEMLSQTPYDGPFYLPRKKYVKNTTRNK